MIRNITLENFQGFAGKQSFHLSKFNLLFGANSTGKSSILRALELFIYSLRFGAVIDEDLVWTDDSYEYPNAGFIFDQFAPLSQEDAKYAKSGDEPLSIEIDFEYSDQSSALDPQASEMVRAFPRFRIKITTAEVNGVNQTSFEPLDMEGKAPWKVVGSNLEMDAEHPWWSSESGLNADKDELNNLQWFGLSIKSNFPNFEEGALVNKAKLNSVDFLSGKNLICWLAYLKSVATNLIDFRITEVKPIREIMETVRLKKSLKQGQDYSYLSEESINQICLDFKSLTNRYELLLNYELPRQKGFVNMLLDYWTGSLQIFTNVGTGLSTMIPVLAAMQEKRSSILFIGEPELHIHPKLQGELAILMVNRSRAVNGQVIIETHSENVLLAIQREIHLGALESEYVQVIFTEGRLEPGARSKTEVDEVLNKLLMSLNSGAFDFHGFNVVRNMELDSSGDLLDPFPESFAHMRANYLYGSRGENHE